MKTPLLLSSLLLSFLISGQAQEVSPKFTINWSAPIPDSEIFLVSNDKNLLYYAGFEKRVHRKKKVTDGLREG